MHWIHFIGKSYYSTPKTFVAEAQKYGVSRRISLQQAKAMRYGDTVLLAQWEKERQAAYVFGSFVVTSLYGHGLTGLLGVGEGEAFFRDPVSVLVLRECGEFTVCAVCTNPLDIPELLARVDEDHPVSNLMVGGAIRMLQPYYLKDIHHRQGFRSIDGAELAEAVAEGFARAKCPVIRGQFYVWGPLLTADEQKEVDGLIYEVEQYRKR